MRHALRILAEREVLVFDLDGTLVDSGPDIRGTLDLALRDCGIAGVAEDDWVNLHSPLADIVRDALARRQASAAQSAHSNSTGVFPRLLSTPATSSR